MEHQERAAQLATVLAPVVVALVRRPDLDEEAREHLELDLENPHVEELVRAEMAYLVRRYDSVRVAAQRLSSGQPATKRQRRSLLLEIERVLDNREPDRCDALWTLLTGVGATLPAAMGVPTEHHVLRRKARASYSRIGRQIAATAMLGIIAGVITVAVLFDDRQYGQLSVLEIFGIWAMSFLPGWLFVRFIGQRAGALWHEYVLNLHRLGVDEPQHLPRPPVTSVYYSRWFEGGGPVLSGSANIYREKFDAYYGKDVSRASSSGRGAPWVSPGTLFPVFLTTALLATGWTAVLWGGRFLPRPTQGAPDWNELDVMAYGFAGAYLFIVQMLVRRYFQSDLKASAYASAVMRIVVVLLLVAALHKLDLFDGHEDWEATVAFVVGLFPLVGMQVLQRAASAVLKVGVPTLRVDYPLSDLQGLNIWYEARLLEEGIEDMQNLATANVVDVILHTRVPVGRLVDWQDQALLYLRLPPRQPRQSWWRRTVQPGDSAAPAAPPAAGADGAGRPAEVRRRAPHPRDTLRRIGVANATSFLEAFTPPGVAWSGELATDGPVGRLVEWCEQQPGGLDAPVIETLCRLLHADPALEQVRSWRRWRAALEENQASIASSRRGRAPGNGAGATIPGPAPAEA